MTTKKKLKITPQKNFKKTEDDLKKEGNLKKKRKQKLRQPQK
jgi:hypothetical protein